MKWTIRRQILVSFGVILALTLVVAAVAYMRLSRIDQEAAAVKGQSLPALEYAASIQDAWSDDFLLTEEYVLQSDQAVKQRILARVTDSRVQLGKLMTNYESTITRPSEREAFDEFKTARTSYARVQDDVLHASEKNASGAMDAMNTKLVPEFDAGTSAIQAVVALNRMNADDSTEQISADAATSKIGVVVGLLAAFVLAGVCGVSLLRITNELARLVGQVQKSGIQVNTSVTEISATAKEQQATANEIAATTTEIGATSREISATSKELVKTMNEVSTVADQSATLAGAGQAGLTHMEDTMRLVMDAAGSVNAKLVTLSEKAGDISQVVTTITKVADQTNLLSLNAAIEAEKAGEYGRGFAVVATEIRRLADQTAVATYDIDQTVKAIQSAVSAGVMSMDKFSEEVRRGMQAVQDVGLQLSQVIQQVQALAPRFEAVTEGMQAQAAGAEQITEALTQLSEAARQTVESLRQSTLAIDELNQVAVGLKAGVSQIKVAA